MFARYFFAFLGFLSLIWIGYVAVGIIDRSDAWQPENLFGKEDGKVLIINRPQELSPSDISFSYPEKIARITTKLIPVLEDNKSIFISEKRPHFMIESKFQWTPSRLKKLAGSAKLPLEEITLRTFKSGKFTFEIHKTILYCYIKKFSTTPAEDWDNYDHLASACLIDFSLAKTRVTDIYKKGGQAIEFKSEKDPGLNGKQVRDLEIYPEVLPAGINSYHFIEKEWLASQDSVFKINPMYQWIDKGLVEFELDKNNVIICDYKDGQQPINLLFDYIRKEPTNSDNAHFKNVRLTKDFPQSTAKGFYVYLLNNYAVISESQSACEQVITANKLGKTLVTNTEKAVNMFSGLPQSVSERTILPGIRATKSIYRQHLFETQLLTDPATQKQETTPEKQEIPSLSMNTNGTVKEFLVLPGQGNCIALTDEGQLIGFTNGKKHWSQTISGKILNELVINTYQNILITTAHSIHCFTRSGQSVFPVIQLNEAETAAGATQYQWKGKSYLAVPLVTGEIIVFDQSGTQTSRIKTGITQAKSPIDCWVSQNKLFFGVRDERQFKMYDVARKREYRSFNAVNIFYSKSESNELIMYSLDGNQIYKINQKGTKKALFTIKNGYSITPQYNNQQLIFIAQHKNQLEIFDENGQNLARFTLKISQPEAIAVEKINSSIIVAGIDGLENNIFLHTLEKRTLIDEPLEGSKIVHLSSNTDYLYVSTVLDSYIIQYKIKL